jgi:hypothetical protein
LGIGFYRFWVLDSWWSKRGYFGAVASHMIGEATAPKHLWLTH